MMREHSRRQFLVQAGAGIVVGAAVLADGPRALAKTFTYSRGTDPLALDAKLERLVASFNSGSDRDKVDNLFKALHKGGPKGVKVLTNATRPPRTATEVLAHGGDCTDFAFLVVALLKRMGIPGGAKVVHFASSPSDTDHMVAYAIIEGKEKIIDLQAPSLGATKQGSHKVLLRYSYDQAAAMYHREWGDYLRITGKLSDAVTAYKRSLEIYEKDAFVHKNLSFCYEQKGDMEAGARHAKRAAELDPKKYARDKKRGSYNEELKAGEKARQEGRWADCIGHFQNALRSGENVPAEHRKVIQSYIDSCKKRL